MSVRVSINGRRFLLTWNEFEKALAKASLLKGNNIEVLSVEEGGSYVAA